MGNPINITNTATARNSQLWTGQTDVNGCSNTGTYTVTLLSRFYLPFQRMKIVELHQMIIIFVKVMNSLLTSAFTSGDTGDFHMNGQVQEDLQHRRTSTLPFHQWIICMQARIQLQ